MGVYSQEGDVDANGTEEVNLRTSAGAELLGSQTSVASLPVVIASDQIVPISAVSLPLPTGAATSALQTTIDGHITDGSLRGTVRMWDGTNIVAVNTDGTIIARSAEQQLAAENKVFSMNFEVGSIGSSEIPVALFRNPNGSGKTVKLIRFTFSNVHTVTSFIRIRAYAAPTVTSDGTALTEGCTHLGQAGGVVESFSSPTISANGTRLAQWLAPSFSQPTQIPLDMLFILDANTTILLTAQGDGTNRVLAGSVIWAEV